jgi:hypothetical protein
VTVLAGDNGDLGAIGLHRGDTARFRNSANGRWQAATITGLERDGSIAMRDSRGSARSIHFQRVEVLHRGARGRPHWTPVADIAVMWEQLPLFGA